MRTSQTLIINDIRIEVYTTDTDQVRVSVRHQERHSSTYVSIDAVPDTGVLQVTMHAQDGNYLDPDVQTFDTEGWRDEFGHGIEFTHIARIGSMPEPTGEYVYPEGWLNPEPFAQPITQDDLAIQVNSLVNGNGHESVFVPMERITDPDAQAALLLDLNAPRVNEEVAPDDDEQRLNVMIMTDDMATVGEFTVGEFFETMETLLGD